MISEINFSSLKNAHQVREYEERKSQERKRNLLYLMAQYLRDEGYYEAVGALSSEAQLTNQYEVCDNVDLPTILQDYESYYYVRFQKYPKICKRLNPEEVVAFSSSRRPLRFRGKKFEKSSGKTKEKANSPTKAVQPPPAGDAKSDPEVTVIQLGLPKKVVVDRIERTLKPLGGCGMSHNGEWMDMAEMITKDICMVDLNVHWDDVMGLDEAKRLLKEAVVYPIRYPELFTGLLTPWKGLLLFGPPGTGKTLLAKAVATECRTTFFNISASSIVSKWRGDSEKLVKVMFDLARYHAPSTIFIDEIDALASMRDGGSHSSEHEASRRLKSELLIQLDGLAHTADQVFLLATSNLPWELDPSMLRRLEKRILVDLPNMHAREAMFRHYLPVLVLKEPPLKCDLLYEFLAKETDGYSGSDIHLVCKETAMESLRKVFQVLERGIGCDKVNKLTLETINTHDVQRALDKTKPSASHLIEKHKAWRDQFGSL